jgi:putative FmdB family regulatory protein
MPTYEYKCAECDHYLEEFQGINDAPLQTCPVCGGPLKRILSGGAGVIYKGSGFYTTDYKNRNEAGSITRCGKEQTCCGRDVPCEKPSCND